MTVLVVLITLFAYWLHRSIKLSLFILLAFFLIINLGYWQATVQTISLVGWSAAAGVIIGVPRQAGEGRIAGRVITVKIGNGVPSSGEPRHLGTTAVELAGPADIIVVEQHANREAGSWGGLLSLGASVRGVAGVISAKPSRLSSTS